MTDGISVAQLGGQDGQARISEAAERNEGNRESYSCHGSAEVDKTADAFDTTDTCGECGASEFDQSSSGEWYCAECGLLQSTSEVEFSEPSWTPADERRTSPASGPSRLGLGTVIGNTGGSTPRWAKYNTRLSHDKETLRHGLKEIRAVGAALEASAPIVDQAATFFRDAAEEGLLVGQSLEAMAAGCVHAAARDCHRPFPTKAVAAVSPVDDEVIRSAYSKLVREFNLRVAPPTPAAFIPRFSADAELSQDVQRRGRQLVETIIEDGSHVGQSPTGVAAAALYGAAVESGTDITQKELAEVAHVSVVTLSRQWQTIQTYLEDGL